MTAEVKSWTTVVDGQSVIFFTSMPPSYGFTKFNQEDYDHYCRVNAAWHATHPDYTREEEHT